MKIAASRSRSHWGRLYLRFFRTATGETITIATSVISSLTFPFYLAAMRRGDLADDPRFRTAEDRKANLQEFYEIFQL
jgi:crotonobetainyl-CoA:carnitine CoA-transferase CaiB-like acyl-CoA transferase